MVSKEFKSIVIEHCKNILSAKIEALRNDIEHLKNDIAEDTKSSAGDKFETSREMANQERQKLSNQLELTRRSLGLLENIRDLANDKIKVGHLIETDSSLIFITISLGIELIQDQHVLVVSPNSPLGQAFLDKTTGDVVDFNGKAYLIKEIS